MEGAPTVAEVLAAHLARHGYSTADYDAPWVHTRIGVPIVFPNVRARRRAIRFHDLHHLATGYAMDLRGEAEVGAWELAACGRDRPLLRFWAAWVLNLAAVLIGLLLCPRRVYRAFVRGRACTSAYRAGPYDELLALDLDTLRARLGLIRGIPGS